MPSCAVSPHHWDGGCFVLDDPAALQDAILEDALEHVLPPHDPFLNDDDDLAGISAKELRAFWHALFRWSMVASWLYLDAISYGKHQQHDRLPTQIVRRRDFVDGIAVASGLPVSVVTACLTRLSFGWSCPKKPDIYLQPLLCGNDHVAWSPHLIQLCKYKRNMLKLMARIPALKPVADNLIGSRERSLGPQFGKVLGSHGWQFKCHMPLPDGSGEIDLLAFHHKYSSEMFVVELKGVLGVDEVNEVEHATREMIAGQKQVRNSVAFLQNADVTTKTSLWKGVPWHAIRSYYGMVLTPNAQPNSSYDHREIPAVTLDTVRTYFFDSDFRSPARLWKTSADKRWLKKYATQELTYRPLTVGDLTYEIPEAYYT